MEAEQPSRRRLPVSLSLPILSLAIASLSMVSSISQSYNYRRNIESVQQNVLRAENLKTCRDIIEVFFAFRLKAEEANAYFVDKKFGPWDRYSPTNETVAELAVRNARVEFYDKSLREMKSLVYRFGALGTYLANFAPERARERYSRLSWLLNDIAAKAASLSKAEFDAKFTEADQAFGTLNEDCAKSAQFVKI